MRILAGLGMGGRQKAKVICPDFLLDFAYEPTCSPQISATSICVWCTGFIVSY